jgi:hypothetical protein
MSTTDSDTDTSDIDSGEHLHDYDQHIPLSDPHIRQTDRCRQFLETTGDISDRVLQVLNLVDTDATCHVSYCMLQVLDLMDELHLNLPLFLWAISWNVPELTSNSSVRFARPGVRGPSTESSLKLAFNGLSSSSRLVIPCFQS